VRLLADGTKNNAILGFCLAVISRHAEKWPPTEQVLAEQFVSWFGVKTFLTRDAMRQLCLSKGINLSFVALPTSLHGFNCSFQDKKEIVISERENVAFGDLHTLFHEFREMIEHALVDLGHATLTHQGDSLEETAEEFAILVRMETCTREMPAYLEMAGSIETKWHRYFGYAFVVVFFVSLMFSCAFLPQFEEMISEARRQRYVRT
jgi:hypothetical protein